MSAALDLERAGRIWSRLLDRKIDETLSAIDRCIAKGLPFDAHQRRLEAIEELRARFKKNFDAARESGSASDHAARHEQGH